MSDPIGLTISVSALVVSVVTALRQQRASESSNAVTVILDVFREFRSPEMVKARRYVMQRLDPAVYDPCKGMDGLPADLKYQAIRISHFFDQLGVLVAHDLVSRDAIVGFLGGSVLSSWDKLSPYIRGDRQVRNAEYQEYFEMLTNICGRDNPKSVLDRVRRRRTIL